MTSFRCPPWFSEFGGFRRCRLGIKIMSLMIDRDLTVKAFSDLYLGPGIAVPPIGQYLEAMRAEAHDIIQPHRPLMLKAERLIPARLRGMESRFRLGRCQSEFAVMDR